MPRLARLLCLTAMFVCALCGVAVAADGPVGADPSSNFSVDTLPPACNQPTSSACLDASVGFLNQARANLGQPAYQLPTDFNSLAPALQEFVLANLDRILYGLPPITGVTAALSQDATGGVQSDNDPRPSDSSFNYWTANWAGGFDNVVLAYEAWMYDDGPGSGNLDCTPHNSSGCWGHRHDVLWSFSGSGPLAAGVAVGTDPAGSTGYAMLLGEGDASSYQPTYTYTWSQAVANGAGTTPGAASASNSGGGSGSGSGSGAGAAHTPAVPRVGVTVTVHGAGTVIDQSGRSCHTATCTFSEIPGQPVHLVAHGTRQGAFTGWTGACSGDHTTCTLSPGATGAVVGASFQAPARITRRQIRGQASRLHLGRGSVHAEVSVGRHRIVIRISSSAGAAAQCALTARSHGHFGRDRFHACRASTTYSPVARGVYRLRVRADGRRITAYLRAR